MKGEGRERREVLEVRRGKGKMYGFGVWAAV
jgi:hypothetical protein